MPKVTMPQLGESVAEGTIGKWLKQVGDHVDKYEALVEVITDKVNAEVPSPFEGTLTEILAQEGATVPNNAEIAVVESTAEAAAAQGTGDGRSAGGSGPSSAAGARQASPAGAVSPPAQLGAEGASDGSEGIVPEGRTILGTGVFGPAGSDERRPEEMAVRPAASGGAPAAEYEGRVTPAVRRLAREHGLDLALIAGTGHAGRVTREDILGYVEAQRTGTAAPQVVAPAGAAGTNGSRGVNATPVAGPAASPPAGASVSQGQTTAMAAGVDEELKPQTPMRKSIAAHMVKAKQTAPHAYTTVEVDMSGVVGLRESIKGRYQATEGVGLSFVPFVTKAVVEALKRHADLNAHWTDEGLVRKRHINVGIAVAVDDGLVVPVIKDADQLSINGLNRAIQDLATRARANQLKLEDIQGGTFTVNNTGWFGSVASQPIINVPQIAILSMEAIVKRAVVMEGPAGDSIAIRPIMNVCVSFDHRGTDGAQIGRFVQDVRSWLQAVDSNTPIW